VSRLADLGVRPAASGAPAVAARESRRLLRPTKPSTATVVVLVLAAIGFAARLPFLTRPLTPDEGGFLMVAGQWVPGSSLYGNYWVDRPPLLITLFQVADLLGGPVGLRLMGATSVGVSVLLAAVLGRSALRLDGRRTPRTGLVQVCAATTALVFLATPSFGAPEVDGELLATPFVLGGLVAVFKGSVAASRHALAWWAIAGVLAVAAAAVKQNMLEVFVAATVVILAGVRRSPSTTARALGAFLGAAAVTTLALIGWAALHGTSPAALWDAIVTFRLEASSVIARSAPSTTHGRALELAAAYLGSGALGIALLALATWLRHGAGRRPALLGSVAAAVWSWELFGVFAGGSYWLHYLVATVGGLVLVTCLAAHAGRRGRVALGAVLAYAGVLAAVALVTVALTPIGASASDVSTERYLATHEQPGDTGVVAFGDPALLQAAHLASPYAELWSLPVRVRDPQLIEFSEVLSGPNPPTWVVVNGDSLATWGVDPSLAESPLKQRYVLTYVAGDWHVFHLRTDGR
jgi:hypothetical protein